MNKLSAQNIMEEQVKNQLQMKKALQAKLMESDTDPENLKNVEEEIRKLKEIYAHLKTQKGEGMKFQYPREAR